VSAQLKNEHLNEHEKELLKKQQKKNWLTLIALLALVVIIIALTVAFRLY
jgi:predicted lysophospholipase L1 biosynthesis ABC-type transport system permease subunit